MKQEQGKLFIVSGPSGVGKTTVIAEFLKKFGSLSKINRVVTYTTRMPRPKDVHGLDYHFISTAEFEHKIAAGFFLEWSKEYGSFYGTPISILQDIAQGSSCVLIIDRVGASQIIKKYSGAILIWIQVSSTDVLCYRLKSRNCESFEQIQTRLFLAKKEIAEEASTPMYHYYIDNIDLEVAVQGVFEVVRRSLVLPK